MADRRPLQQQHTLQHGGDVQHVRKCAIAQSCFSQTTWHAGLSVVTADQVNISST
jgi:hypothetical protein